jgi:type I restriction enzyme S subunit
MKPGYKQTEVGVIPEEWEVKSIRDFASIKTGPFGTLLKADEYSGSDGVPLISVGEVGAGRFRITEHTPLVPEKVVRRLPQYVLRAGDIVFGRKGAVDRSALVTQAEDGWFLGSDGISIRPTVKYHPPYLAAQFQRNEIQTWLLQNAIGTTMASLNQGILSRVQVPYAPIPEQIAIAEALGDVDALLDGLERLIAKKRDIKQATMQQLLTGQTRLPGFTGKWVNTILSNIGKFKNGLNKNISEFGHGLPFVNLMDVFGVNNISSTLNLGLVASTKIDREAYDLRQGDVLFIRSSVKPSGVGLTAVVENDLTDTVYSGFLIRFRDEGVLDTNFKRYCFYSDCFRKKIISASSVSANTNINQNALGTLSIPLPPTKSEQTAIAAVLTDMDNEIAALEARRDKTRALKQGMMQELLTGRTRLV